MQYIALFRVRVGDVSVMQVNAQQEYNGEERDTDHFFPLACVLERIVWIIDSTSG